MRPLTRRAALATFGAGTSAAALAACAPAAAPGPAPQAQQQPKAGGTLVTARTDDPTSLDGHVFGSQSLHTLYGTVYERLIDYDAKLNPQPMLAESWEQSTDGKQLKLTLRKGVTWHTGRDFTSDDAKWNLQRVQDPKIGNGSWAAFGPLLKSLEAPDKSTIIVRNDPARPALVDFFVQFNMLDRESVTEQKKAVGTGPFTFGEWRQGQFIAFAKNKSYWRSGRPYLDAIQINVTSDPQALVLRMESDDVMVISDPPISELGRLKADPKWGSIVISPGYYAARINPASNPLLADKRVRQALSMSIDRKRFVTSVLQGLSDPVNLPWPPYSEAYEPQKQAVTAFDLERAKALFAQAGAANAEIELIYRANESAEIGPLSQIWQADLAKIGVKMTVRALEAAVYSSTTRQFNYQISTSTSADSQYHPANLFFRQNPPPFVVDRKLADQVSTEPDPAKRKALYSRINDEALDAALDLCYGYSIRATVFNASKVAGLARGINNMTMYGDAWLKG